jgi:mono/diheme cytochrome c family protein
MSGDRDTGSRTRRFAARRLLAAALLGIGWSAVVQAESGRTMPASAPPVYLQECASCHTAYPPGMLPARSWRRILDGLERHYGTDASVDAATLHKIDAWLQAHAATAGRAAEAPPEDRITRAAWFVREHRKIDPAVWKLASVKSAANCAACHGAADRGRFDENELRLPQGLDARQRRAWSD